MKLFLVGHRGVGKTSLLRRLEVYHDYAVPIFDLDAEIEKDEGEDIFFIFQSKGEDYFRRRELEVFHKLCEQNESLILSLGAGFKLDRAYFPKGADVLWVLRQTDPEGRIFLDRPRLNQGKSQPEEYLERFEEREILYQRFATRFYLMPEGIQFPNEQEKSLMLGRGQKQGGVITPDALHVKNWSTLITYFSKWNFDWVELRDDLLTDEQIEEILPALPREKVLLSYRRKGSSELFDDLVRSGYSSDWPLELVGSGRIRPEGPPGILEICSSHSDSKPQTSSIRGNHLKWSPMVEDWARLEQGLQWQAEDPANRSYLPRSKDGRWQWVRLFMKGRQKLNFFRIGRGLVSDQPSAFEWLATPAAAETFAAVLGYPVHFSWSPVEQMEFFLDRGLPFFRINITEAEADVALHLLSKLGLRAAAVTSPLKRWAFSKASSMDTITENLKSVNTLAWSSGQWIGKNTDLLGFQELAREVYDLGIVCVWGGGGTKAVISEVLPAARFYSSRTGKLLEAQGNSAEAQPFETPKTVVWAAAADALPPSGPADEGKEVEWLPLRVIDLNYRENSNARKYALERRCQYFSGEKMFHAQAEGQRIFWERFL